MSNIINYFNNVFEASIYPVSAYFYKSAHPKKLNNTGINLGSVKGTDIKSVQWQVSE